MKGTYQVFIVLLACIMGIFIACRHQTDLLPGSDPGNGSGSGSGNGPGSGPGNCDPDKVYFQQQVLPILISNCAMSGCHDNASHQDGVILTSYQTVMATADVRPGRPENSDLYEVITDTDPEDRMPRPPQAPLQQDQIALIRKWIEQGAVDLTCNSGCDTTQFTYNTTIKPIIVNYCQGCHSGTAAQGGIDLSTYSGIKARVDDGRLWGAINHFSGYSPMPKNGNKLADCEITQIRKWIESGASNN